MVAAAIAGSAVAGLAGAAISGSAAKSAANTQAAAADQASQNALQQYNQTRTDLGPYRTIGQNAADQLAAIFGLPTTPFQTSGDGGGGAAPTTLSGAPSAATGAPGTPAPNGLPTSLPAGWRISQGSQQPGNDGAGGVTDPSIIDQNGQVVATLSGYGATQVSPSQAAQYLVTQGLYPGQQFAGGQQAAAGAGGSAAAPPSPGANPLASYGLSGLTYQTPGNLQSVLSNPQYQTPAGLQSVLSNPQFKPTQAQLESTPGYQFDLAQGLLGVANSSAAKGQGISGNALKGAGAFATGLANNTLTTQAGIFNQNYGNALNANTQGSSIFGQNYQNALNANTQGSNIFQNNLGNIINPLQYLTTLGQNSAVQTGSQGIQAINNSNQALIGGANAQAAGMVGSANALSSGISGLANSGTNYLLFNNLLNSNNPGAAGGPSAGAAIASGFGSNGNANYSP